MEQTRLTITLKVVDRFSKSVRLPKHMRRMITRNAGGTARIHNGGIVTDLHRSVARKGMMAGRFGPGNFGRKTKPPIADGWLHWYWMVGWRAGRDDKGDQRYVGCRTYYDGLLLDKNND